MHRAQPSLRTARAPLQLHQLELEELALVARSVRVGPRRRELHLCEMDPSGIRQGRGKTHCKV